MKNLIRTLCLALSLVTASASASSVNGCDVVGTYINNRLIDIGPPVGLLNNLTLLELHADGTASEQQSIVQEFPNTTGTGAVLMGAWELKKDLVTVTLIGWDAAPTTVEDCCDVELAAYTRFTLQFRVVDKNTLERIESVRTEFPLSAPTETIVSGPGTSSSSTATGIIFKKVHVVFSDL